MEQLDPLDEDERHSRGYYFRVCYYRACESWLRLMYNWTNAVYRYCGFKRTGSRF